MNSCSMLRAGLFAALLAPAPACVSSGRHEQEMATLSQSITALQERLDGELKRRAELESRVGRLNEVAAAKADATTASDLGSAFQQQAARVDTLTEALAAEQIAREDLSRKLADQDTRWQALRDAVAKYENETPAQRLFELQKSAVEMEKRQSDLAAQVETNRRVGQSTADRLAELSQAVATLSDAFNQQMKLLERYINEQFVPLADGLATFLYNDAKRMTAAAGELDQLGRDIDPYKFKHLVPSIPEDKAAQAVDDGD